jgi:hypothetical protein
MERAHERVVPGCTNGDGSTPATLVMVRCGGEGDEVETSERTPPGREEEAKWDKSTGG